MILMKKKSLSTNPELNGMARWERDVCFSTETGTALYLQLLLPWNASAAHPAPLLIFVQGSGYRFPHVEAELPQLAAFARMGYVAALVTHRNSEDGHMAPAFLLDVKTAIRFLRKESARFGIDSSRAAIWGTSSGGSTALLVGLTGDDPQFETGEHAGFSDAVQAVVNCFGPVDILEMYRQTAGSGRGPNWEMLLGSDPAVRDRLLRLISPLSYLDSCTAFPPFLLLHGDRDELVPWEQSERMARELESRGVDVTFITVTGAPHEGAFWSPAVLDEIAGFLKQILPPQ